MNNVLKFKLAHEVTRKTVGKFDYRTTFSSVLKSINKKDIFWINSIIDLASFMEDNGVVATEKKVNTTKEKKQAKKVAKHSQSIESIDIPFIDKYVPTIILQLFPSQFDGVMSIINKNALYINQRKGYNLTTRYQLHMDGIKELEKLGEFEEFTIDMEYGKNGKTKPVTVTTYKKLQSIMLTYFLGDIVKYHIHKYLEMGINYKTLNEKDNQTLEVEYSYQNAPSNYGKIDAFNVEELYHTLIMDSMRLLFNADMFGIVKDENGNTLYGTIKDKNGNIVYDENNEPIEFPFTNVGKVLYYRISNLMQIETRKLRNQTKVYTEECKTWTEATTWQHDESEVIAMADMANIFDNEEMKVLKYRLNGRTDAQIKHYIGKRPDRIKQRIERKFAKYLQAQAQA